MTSLLGLRCHVCAAKYPADARWVCEECLGPLEPEYDYDLARRHLTRDTIESRPRNLWRYRELLPIAGEPRTGFHSGFTPLVRANRLAAILGVSDLYIKDDSVNHPTLSYKDRVVSIAATRAIELGFEVFGCASTGNLANSVSAHAARLGLECFVFIPHDLEQGKILGSAIFRPQVVGVRGNYDDVNRLCTQIADRYRWGFANINLRSYYAEGAKTLGFEIAEQLGWRFPRHIVSPVAGGTLLPRIAKGLRELQQIGLVQDEEFPRIHAAQAAGCAPVVRALEQGLEFPEPVKPQTVAKSIAIGNPADGFQAVQTVKATGGSGAASSDEEILVAMELLAETEGIFTEPAGGATLAAAMSLIRRGVISRGDSVVVCITGNGYKTAAETVASRLPAPAVIGRSLDDFEAFLRVSGKAATTSAGKS
jgi:threonine synthase